MITIIDYGTGNIGSLGFLFKRIKVETILTRDPQVIQRATKIILPGIGAFDHAMRDLEAHALIPLLNEKVLNEKIPLLGICLGAQILGLSSEEGDARGLGWIEMTSQKFSTTTHRVPHIGWQEVHPQAPSILFEAEMTPPRFYFVHSYHMVCSKEENILAKALYDTQEFTCAVRKDNIYGVQFHPEKSHRFGTQLLKHFAYA